MLPAGRLETFRSDNHLPPQKWTNSINQDRKTSLLAWKKETGIELVQINGQRRYGGPPPGWVGDPPPAGTEVYIGKLPQDLYEDVLIPLFQSVGKLYEFRLMMTFSGLNRGFAYAKYSSPRGARDAIAALNHYPVRQGCTIVVCWSTQKRELSVDGLAASVSQQELEATLQRATQGILSVTLHASPCQRQAKLAVLKYSSHQAAALAKKALMEGNLRLRGSGMRVEWLHPDLKQKLQLWEERAPASQVQENKSLVAAKPLALPPAVQNMLDHLNTLRRRQCLGMPLFLTKCIRVNPNGWLQFWYQVQIPGYPMPFSGFTWVRQDGQGQSRHEEAKAAVALHMLRVLGEPLQSPSWHRELLCQSHN
ncbi:dead end protein homolog 1 isoform X1 [Pseudopipra pipra]|uniref:dead end protein homolog 1 isoform X1 n=1 Tax=Pseudopipra pipra TaxID=415032 RepID=UPI0031388BC5